MSIQKGVADFTHIIGAGLIYGGGAALLVMAVVGTVSIDLVLLAYAEKSRNDFLTGYILGSMFSGPRADPRALLIVSPITSGVAILLSFALGVPGVGLAILAGWLVAAAVVGLGVAVSALADAIDPEPSYGFSYA